MVRTAPYQHKVRKLYFFNNETDSSSKESIKQNKGKQKDSRERSDNNQHKNKFKPYEDINCEFKKIKPPMFNG